LLGQQSGAFRFLHENFFVREILNSESLEPVGECNVERRRQQGEQYIDATAGDIQLNRDSRARPARLRQRNEATEILHRSKIRNQG
jgi:hypothetical protein